MRVYPSAIIKSVSTQFNYQIHKIDSILSFSEGYARETIQKIVRGMYTLLTRGAYKVSSSFQYVLFIVPSLIPGCAA